MRRTLKSVYFWLLPIFALSCFLRAETIKKSSPTFDEMFYVVQAVNLHQYNAPYKLDLHPLTMPWLFSWAVPFIGHFEDIQKFSAQPEVFASPFQYRMDKISTLASDEVIQRFRFFSQIFWVMIVVSVFFILRKFGMSDNKIVVVLAFLALEPWLLGLTSLMENDVVVTAMLLLGTALSLSEKRVIWLFSIIAFAAAWSTKFSAILWIVPLGASYVLDRAKKSTKILPYRTTLFWLGGIPLGLLWAWYLGFDFQMMNHPTHRTTYLDGILTNQTDVQYFLQGFLNRSSLCFLILLGASALTWRHSKSRLWVAAFLIGSLLLSSQIFPGIGVRLILPLTIAIMVLVVASLPSVSNAVLFFLICFLAGEAWIYQDSLISYQNILTGSEPKLLDSNSDWGQGLKELSAWRNRNQDSELALSLFGGAPPEMYGIENYRALPSFPEISKKDHLTAGVFKGYVAVSKNFLYGYVLTNPSIVMLKNRKPVRCFRDVLCLYDVRGDTF